MNALAESKGSGADGGKGKDQMRVLRRVVIDVPPGAWQSQAVEGFEISLSF
jgi:hypothetical protein